MQLKSVHTALWPHCPNENVFSNCLDWPYDSPHSPSRLGGRLFQTCGPEGAKVLSPNRCASDWQRVFECRQNAVVWHGRRRRADSRRPGNPGGGGCRTRTSVRSAVFRPWHRPTIIFLLVYCPVGNTLFEVSTVIRCSGVCQLSRMLWKPHSWF